MKINYVLILAILNSISKLSGQNTVEKFVFAAAGNNDKINNFTIQWTIGETFINTFETSTKIVNQGFHQPIDLTTPVRDFDELASKVELYPNPVSQNELFLHFNEWRGSIKMNISNIDGQLLWQKSITDIFKNSTYKIPVDFLVNGNYLLSFQRENKIPFSKKFTVSRP